MIYDKNNARLLLGVLIIAPELALNEKYPLSKKDFECLEFHLRIYQAVLSLAKSGAKTIGAIDIYNLAKNNEKITRLFDENNLTDFVDTIIQLAKPENIDLYYGEVKKHTLLREYKNVGFDTSFLETDVDKFTIEDIVGYYEALQSSISRLYLQNKVQEEYLAGTDFLQTKEELKSSPLFGASFQSLYLNDIYRGLYGFILRAGKSGYGKTTVGVGDICKVTCKEYWDFNKQKFVENKSRVGAGLIINTEMDLRTELDIIIIAWVSGVPRNHILDGFYLQGEEERVEYARNVVMNSELYLVDNPTFTTKTLVATIKEYVNLHRVKNVFFDYIANNGFVAKEISEETKVPQREDMVLLTLTDRLKQVQRQCNIGLLSAVQTNGMEEGLSYPTESCLAGGKSQVRKTDGTMIMLPPKKAELEIFDMAKENPDFEISENAVCNNITHIIKGRHSKYPTYIKIFQYVDYSTARTYDYFVTDKNGKPIEVKKIRIEYDGRKEV